MKRTALCHCGQLQITCQSEPVQVIMCHCESCQRRTGSSYNLGAWFKRDDFRAEGEEQIYRRTGDQGIESVYHFCPSCGTNIYWEAITVFPDLVAVAVGCFTDPDFPSLSFSLYGKRRLSWVTQLHGIPSHIAGMNSEIE